MWSSYTHTWDLPFLVAGVSEEMCYVWYFPSSWSVVIVFKALSMLSGQRMTIQ